MKSCSKRARLPNELDSPHHQGADGELRLQFSEPLRHIDMNRETARHLASLLVVASEGKRTEPLDVTEVHNG